MADDIARTGSARLRLEEPRAPCTISLGDHAAGSEANLNLLLEAGRVHSLNDRPSKSSWKTATPFCARLPYTPVSFPPSGPKRRNASK